MEDASFSEVIIRISNKEKGNIMDFYGALRNSKKEIGEIKRGIKKRRKEIDEESMLRERRLRKRK